MTAEALVQTSHPYLALRCVEPFQGVGPEMVRLDRFPISVGAGPTCRIRLTAGGARPLHCLLVATDGGVSVRRWADNTQLNGEHFTESLLSVGDRITCGEATFEVVEADNQENSDTEQTLAPSLPVAWPVGEPAGDTIRIGFEGNFMPAAAEPPSLEQAGEVLRLAENCQRLEDELAETRSLLTSLGEELLQARESAAHQATQFTNRIDELEGELAERDNLLMLLQQALEQRIEPLESEAGVETSTGFETESAANPFTSPMAESAESAEDAEDAWDIEKCSADSGEAPLWGGETSSETTPPCDTSGFEDDQASHPTITDSSDSPDAVDVDSWTGEASEPPQATPESLDVSESNSPWSTSDSSQVFAPQDESAGDSALLWGHDLPSGAEAQVPSNPFDSDRAFPEASHGESQQAEGRDESDPGIGNLEASQDAGIADSLDEHPDTATSQFAPLATDGQDVVPRDDSLDGPFENSDLATSEASLPQPTEADSIIEKYRHLFDDEEEKGADVGVEPVSVTPFVPASQSTHAEGDDDSIEAYMAKMMARLRGESVSEATTSPAPSRSHVVAASMVESDTPSPKPTRLLSLDELETAAAPERHTNMSALRDLANNSARHAIGMANSRRLVQRAQINLFLSAVAMSAGGYLAWVAPGPTSLEMIGGLIGVAGAGLWGCRTLSFLAKARRESLGEQENEAQAPTEPADTLLPIDVTPSPAAATTTDASLETAGSDDIVPATDVVVDTDEVEHSS